MSETYIDTRTQAGFMAQILINICSEYDYYLKCPECGEWLDGMDYEYHTADDNDEEREYLKCLSCGYESDNTGLFEPVCFADWLNDAPDQTYTCSESGDFNLVICRDNVRPSYLWLSADGSKAWIDVHGEPSATITDKYVLTRLNLLFKNPDGVEKTCNIDNFEIDEADISVN